MTLVRQTPIYRYSKSRKKSESNLSNVSDKNNHMTPKVLFLGDFFNEIEIRIDQDRSKSDNVNFKFNP